MDATADDRAGDPFRFDYESPVLRFGAGSTRDLGDELAAHGLDSALVVTGSTVGSTAAVMDPVREGLGDRLAGVFAETTPDKRLATAFDAADRLAETGADALVAVGGGSSIDVAKVASALAASEEPRESVFRAFDDTGTIPVPDGDLPPVVAVPTTLAGADVSQVAGITAGPGSGFVDEESGGGVGDRRLLPAAVVADPELAATTPESVLAGSAMNGFDKGIETLYAANATPVTDATASRGLGLLADGLRELGATGPTPETMEPVLEGLLLVQYGISRPDGSTLSLIHAFGHGLTRTGTLQQGVAHAIVAPHVLDYLFGEVDGRRDLLAEALGVGDTDDPAAAVVEEVEAVRDSLGLPSRLRDVDGPEPTDFRAIAEATVADAFVANAPTDLDVTTEDAEAVLDAAW
ncbi:iron-containing alcohol dehydrogenase family protein [Halobacterium jilantaiense]|uniref:Alcohol dehydrogenase, class IV n=1 Tax=Halobacterium jilantaiense TaxID=355548 RepID=A0A1I0PYW4_9EURY|nr:iron-containing alcohol dehydrogenase family protein [Halobacterium jilantaiense]SEW19662.1 Alcohol dehydrogenase, class IV [Halobacterium jilantaiense]